MSRRTAIWLAIAIAVSSIAAILFTLALRLSTDNEDLPELVQAEPIDLLDNFATLGLPLLGVLIATRRPENLLGWLFLVAGFGLAFGELGGIYYARATIIDPGSLPLPRLIGWVGNWSCAAGVGTLPFLTLLFPTGRPVSRRWRPAVWLSWVFYAVLMVSAIGFATAIWNAPLTPDEELPPTGDAFIVPAIIALFSLTGMAVVGLVSLVFRYRAAGQEEREQLKWFLFASSFLVVALASDNVTDTDVLNIAILLAQLALYASLAIAILKYRLYDIDILINRTLVYVPLTAILAGLFVASTTLVRTLFTDLTDAGSDASVAASTIGVVALLTPLKNKLQALVDRYFKEQRDALANARKLAAQARSVVEVLDSRRFAETFITEVAAGLNASGMTLEVDAAGASWTVSTGEPSTTMAIEARLSWDDQALGRLLLWPAPSSAGEDEATRAALAEAADVLSQVIGVTLTAAGRQRAEAEAVL
jgi:hypothetical protein